MTANQELPPCLSCYVLPVDLARLTQWMLVPWPGLLRIAPEMRNHSTVSFYRIACLNCGHLISTATHSSLPHGSHDA